MKKLLLLVLLFTNFLCNAREKMAVIEWQKAICASQLDYLSSILKTQDGGYILGGSSMSDSLYDKTENRKGLTDYWIVKLDINANIEWQNTIGGSDMEFLKSVSQTADGGYILGGYSRSGISADKTESNKGGFDYWVVKLNSSGNIEWQKDLGGSDDDMLNSIKQTADGGYILGGSSASYISGDKIENNCPFLDSLNSANKYDFWIVKLNSTGNIEWQNTIGGNLSDDLKSIEQTTDGGYIFGGNSNSYMSCDKAEHQKGIDDYWVVKVNSLGVIEWQKTIGGNKTDILEEIKLTADGGYILAGESESAISGDKTDTCRGNYDYWLVKINESGNIQWQKTIGGNDYEYLKSVVLTTDGGYLLGGYSKSRHFGEKVDANRGLYDYWVVKLDSSANIQWQKTIGGNENDLLFSICQTSPTQYVVAGYTESGISGEKSTVNCGASDYWILKLKEFEANTISGKIFQAKNSNCIQDVNEIGIQNLVIETVPKKFFGISDTTGKFSILTDTGKYAVKQIISRYAASIFRNTVCPASGVHQNISFTQYGQDTTEINFANDIALCAYLQVEFTQYRMRRCFNNYATIKYCNIGNIDTNNVQVIVTLPEYVTFVSASNPNYTIIGKKITFNIGSLRANECGTIYLTTKVDCVNGITGLTQCITAYILPRNTCVDQLQPDYALWDKSEVSVDGRCTGNTARFVIKNIGQNNMNDSSSYRIYKDAVQAVSKKFKLLAGDSLVINVTATGNTYRLEADQVPHFPSASTPNITIENCGTGVASRGFVNQMPQNTVAPDVEKICLPIRDSYDPNDKSVSPSGVGTNKLVKHKVPLDYLIRFQNTGTDTAYKVVIVDTLNQNLDLSTLEFGASSHPYKIEFTGSGKPILKFTFDRINLVDSFTNEPKSHGFVSFKITPYDSIPNGTLVKNSADIYFDFNLPIKTNTTQVSIDDRLPTGATLSFVTAVKEQKNNYEAIYVYPNPFNTITTFEFVYNTKAAQLIVYDVNGALVANENVANKTTYQFQRNNLSNGMYFYIVQNKEGEVIGRGKLILQ
ncbi:MAG: T9SS type A sorting domain-containing protein [Chitinophagales bacterium]